jgi:hypothetical protein
LVLLVWRAPGEKEDSNATSTVLSYGRRSL